MNTVIYTIIEKDSKDIQVVYPPLFTEECDYLCFTNNPKLQSSFYKIIYLESLADNIDTYLKEYKTKIYIEPNEIITDSLIQSRSNTYSVIPLSQYTDLSYSQTTEKTCDSFGNYIYTRNPIITGGKYEGRPLLITIAMPVSNQIATIEKCLESIQPILRSFDSELLIADTGSTDGTIEVCKKYGARIIQFPWVNNMSAARNALINNAKGLWYISIDDDEWFESCDVIISFFKTGIYKQYNCATYIQRNYLYNDKSDYTDDVALRLAKITPELHFEGRIHDAIIFSNPNCFALNTFVNHFGFSRDNTSAKKSKLARNVSILYHDMKEYPYNLRFYYQMFKEFMSVDDYNSALSVAISGFAISREPLANHFFDRHMYLYIAVILEEMKDKDYIKVYEYVIKKYNFTPIEKSLLLYRAILHAYHNKKSYTYIHRLSVQFDNLKAAILSNPIDAKTNALLTTDVCSNIADVSLYNAIMYIYESSYGNMSLALKHLKGIIFDCLSNNGLSDITTDLVQHIYMHPEHSRILFAQDLSEEFLSIMLNVYLTNNYIIDTSLFYTIKNDTYRYLFLSSSGIKPDFAINILPQNLHIGTATNIIKNLLISSTDITTIIELVPLSSISIITDSILSDSMYRDYLVTYIDNVLHTKNVKIQFLSMLINEYTFTNTKTTSSDYINKFESYMLSCLAYAELIYTEVMFTIEGPPIIEDCYACAYRYMYANICIQENNYQLANNILLDMKLYFPMYSIAIDKILERLTCSV